MLRVVAATRKHNPTSATEKRSRGRSTCLKITTAHKFLNPSPSGRAQEPHASKHGVSWSHTTGRVLDLFYSKSERYQMHTTHGISLLQSNRTPKAVKSIYWNANHFLWEGYVDCQLCYVQISKEECAGWSEREGWRPLRPPAMLVCTTSGCACLNSCNFMNILQPDDNRRLF